MFLIYRHRRVYYPENFKFNEAVHSSIYTILLVYYGTYINTVRKLRQE